MDHTKFQNLVSKLYTTVSELESMFGERHFTPDGHMVGSIGECLVADAYDLQLMPASNKGYDAISVSGKQVEIKATQAMTSTAMQSMIMVLRMTITTTVSIQMIYCQQYALMSH